MYNTLLVFYLITQLYNYEEHIIPGGMITLVAGRVSGKQTHIYAGISKPAS